MSPQVGQIPFDFDGRRLMAADGQTIAAALLNNGVKFWRTTRKYGRPRGIFCGIGLCFDCLVILNGTANTRACIVSVKAGDVVTSQIGTGRDDLEV